MWTTHMWTRLTNPTYIIFVFRSTARILPAHTIYSVATNARYVCEAPTKFCCNMHKMYVFNTQYLLLHHTICFCNVHNMCGVNTEHRICVASVSTQSANVVNTHITLETHTESVCDVNAQTMLVANEYVHC